MFVLFLCENTEKGQKNTLEVLEYFQGLRNLELFDLYSI